uniref:Uncharacterized protein n=1 Tax=Anguilla anguilla TaxID=7936 RepID=A0A0E9UEU4_ANGAN
MMCTAPRNYEAILSDKDCDSYYSTCSIDFSVLLCSRDKVGNTVLPAL